MRSQQVKTNFSSGAVSPRVSIRSDIDKFDGAMRECINFIVTPQGGLQMREGFKNYGADSLQTETDVDSRIFQFHRGGSESDLLVNLTAPGPDVDQVITFADGESVLFADGEVAIFGIIEDRGLIEYRIEGIRQAYSNLHDYHANELDDVYLTNKEDMVVITHADYPPLFLEIGLEGDIVESYLPSNQVPFHDYRDANSPASSLVGGDTYELTFEEDASAGTDTWAPSRVYMFRYNGVYATTSEGKIREKEYTSDTALMTSKLLIMLGSIPELRGAETTYIVVPNSATSYTITITGPNAGKKMQIIPIKLAGHYCSITNEMEQTETLEPIWSFPTYVHYAGQYYRCIKPHYPTVSNQPPNADYWAAPVTAKPDFFDWSYPDGNDWVADSPSARKTYSPGGRGFPRVGIFYQQRLLLMSNPSMPTGVSGSRIGAYKDFQLGPQDDDPVLFAIDTSDSPQIKWAQAHNRLVLGTSSGDYALGASVTITPSDVQAYKQNSARSNTSAAIAVNTDIFYIEQGREKVRSTGYNDDLKSQISSDISMIAEHLLHIRAKRLAVVHSPAVMVYCLREDGSLIAITYSHENQVGAWYEFTSAGRFIDICTAYNATTDEDELWAVVTYDGGVTRHVEMLKYPARVKDYQVYNSDRALVDQGVVLLDGWVSGSIQPSHNNVITGLDQFEGLVITCLVDNAYTGTYRVTDGSILLDAPPTPDVRQYEGTYAVGFGYTATAREFESSFGNVRGTALGTKRRWNELFVHMLDSALPKINGQLPEDRTPETNMDVAEIQRPGLRKYSVNNLGWGDGDNIITQDRPYPTHVLGFYGQYSSENA